MAPYYGPEHQDLIGSALPWQLFLSARWPTRRVRRRPRCLALPGQLLIRGRPASCAVTSAIPKPTAATVDPGGWLHTCYIASPSTTTAGTCVADRVKELIKYKGLSVAYPSSWRLALLLTHPAVADVAGGVRFADPAAGEVPKAYVVLAGGWPLSRT